MKYQLENLHRRSGITKESCFHAARRLETHNSLSLWALTTLAFSLIVISLITQIYSDNSFIIEYQRFLNFSMTALSILALIISLVVSKSDFSLRANQFKLQAMEINELRISFRHLIEKEADDAEKEELYKINGDKYSNIIKRNLVHDQIDYHISNSNGIENKYYTIKLIVTEFLGYILIMLTAAVLLLWSTINTYENVEYSIDKKTPITISIGDSNIKKGNSNDQ
ncbi:SLATT domain-containing protein [Photobacterium carnosum]|uniref:SLATT domain-containing protein n=1 Tax=Photobacterium carnosum TaxID=2023717 RepID=UPI001E3778CD|nr:SLATT domain-containing protein [Photobacterium carnosum]MCD9516608.1 SLATT domain-containing protein [Photobacterium carnosum]